MTFILSLATGMVLLATASMPAFAEESPERFVGPPSRLQPRLPNETGAPRDLPPALPPRLTALVNPVTLMQPLTVPSVAQLDRAETIPQPLTVDEPQLKDEVFAGDVMVEKNEKVEPLPCYIARPMSSITAYIGLSGDLPTNVAQACAEKMPHIADPRMEYGWAQFDFHWAPTCLCHGPLYFEEINAERYGYTVSYFFQPVISGARFFLTIPALPYKMAVDPPSRCIYTLGHYRPGSCAPRRWTHIPLKVTAAAVQVGTVAGLILLIP